MVVIMSQNPAFGLDMGAFYDAGPQLKLETQIYKFDQVSPFLYMDQNRVGSLLTAVTNIST